MKYDSSIIFSCTILAHRHFYQFLQLSKKNKLKVIEFKKNNWYSLKFIILNRLEISKNKKKAFTIRNFLKSLKNFPVKYLRLCNICIMNDIKWFFIWKINATKKKKFLIIIHWMELRSEEWVFKLKNKKKKKGRFWS